MTTWRPTDHTIRHPTSQYSRKHSCFCFCLHRAWGSPTGKVPLWQHSRTCFSSLYWLYYLIHPYIRYSTVNTSWYNTAFSTILFVPCFVQSACDQFYPPNNTYPDMIDMHFSSSQCLLLLSHAYRIELYSVTPGQKSHQTLPTHLTTQLKSPHAILVALTSTRPQTKGLLFTHVALTLIPASYWHHYYMPTCLPRG